MTVLSALRVALPGMALWMTTMPLHAANPVGARTPAKAFTYTNPLPFTYESMGEMRKELRDPAILREGDTYYLTFTMWPFAGWDETRMTLPNNGSSPGIALYSSKDLKAWKFENWLVKASDLPENSPYRHRFWAPELHKLNGKFYLIFTADNWLKPEYNPAGNRGNAGYAFVGVADRVTGPYRHITYIPGGACDTTLFGDDDGKTYAIMPHNDIGVRPIDLTRLDKGEIRWLGEERRVLDAKNSDIGLDAHPDYLEGPWMEKINGRYTLFYAEIYRDPAHPDFLGYRTGAAIADSIMGPYRKDPRGQVFYGGHLAVFKGPDEGRWFVYRVEDRDAQRGLLAVDPFTVDDQGAVQADPPSTTQRRIPLKAKSGSR